jgi:hypothetical protein
MAGPHEFERGHGRVDAAGQGNNDFFTYQ